MNKPWLAAFALLVCFCACHKENSDATRPAKSPATPVTVIIDQHLSGYPVSHLFQGLSYETGLLTDDPNYLNENNTVLIQLLKNLGRGVLRIGGNSSDEIDWGGDDAGIDTLHRKLTRADINRLAGFAKAINWPVLFGLNLANNDPSSAADEAAYVHSQLRGNFYSFQTGNEPDFFCSNTHRAASYKYRDYQKEWDRYYTNVKGKAPGASFAGELERAVVALRRRDAPVRCAEHRRAAGVNHGRMPVGARRLEHVQSTDYVDLRPPHRVCGAGRREQRRRPA